MIWAHGFQDAGTPVSIPEDQLCISGFCIPDLVNALGFGFATNSYRKTGLAVLEGKADIRNLVDIYAARKGRPSKVYLVGASEGGIITALSLVRMVACTCCCSTPKTTLELVLLPVAKAPSEPTSGETSG